MPPRAVIFDADGVCIQAPHYFSNVYCRQRHLPPGSLEPFFKAEFITALRGEADLKDLITKRHDLWHWDGDPQRLLNAWFKTEDHPNTPLLQLIARLRHGGLPVYLATSQERYRAAYFRQVMFPGVFTDMFISCELGCTKNDDEYWQKVLERIGLPAADIIYFDDSQSHLVAARKAGINSHLYTSVAQVDEALR